jgi:lipopolysaccharide transport system permease protein
MMMVSLLFGKMGNIDSEGVPYQVFSYAAMVPWTFFEYAMPLAGNSLISNSKLISKVYFPRAIIPAAAALSGAVDFFIASIILIFIMIYYHVPVQASLLLWPLFLVPLIVFTTALGMIFSSLNVKYRDIKYTIPFVVSSVPLPVIYGTSGLKVPDDPAIHPWSGSSAFRAAALPGPSWPLFGLA